MVVLVQWHFSSTHSIPIHSNGWFCVWDEKNSTFFVIPFAFAFAGVYWKSQIEWKLMDKHKFRDENWKNAMSRFQKWDLELIEAKVDPKINVSRLKWRLLNLSEWENLWEIGVKIKLAGKWNDRKWFQFNWIVAKTHCGWQVQKWVTAGGNQIL